MSSGLSVSFVGIIMAIMAIRYMWSATLQHPIMQCEPSFTFESSEIDQDSPFRLLYAFPDPP